MKRWRVVKPSELHDWCRSFSINRQGVVNCREELAKSVMGRRKKTHLIVNGLSFTGFRYVRQTTDDIPDDRLKWSKATLEDGTRFLVPHKKNKASKELARQMATLRFKPTTAMCGMLGIEPITFRGLNMRINDPGLKYVAATGTFYITTIDEFSGHDSLERVSDVEFEALPESE